MAHTWTPLGAAVDDVLRRLVPPGDACLEVISHHWSECAGPAVAGQTSPMSYQNGVLTVHVIDHIWLTELRSGLGRDIEKNLRETCPVKLTRIVWRVGKVHS